MEFGHNGGTIGRSLESDWVLPDGQRYLSSRHASIDFRSGSYYVVDTSTNGVYVNDGEQPVGRGNPQRLFTGDRIRIGEYEMSVEITDEDDTRETLTDDRHVDPVSKAQRVPPPDPTRADMVAPHEITAVGIEMLISEEVEIGQIQRLHKANVASLRLEEDAPKVQAKPQAEPPPRQAPRAAAAAARSVRSRRPSARLRASPARFRRLRRPPPATAAIAVTAKAGGEAPVAKPTPSAPPPAAVATPARSTRSSAAPAYRANGSTTSKPSRCCTAWGSSCVRSCWASPRICICAPSRRTCCACRRRRFSRRTTTRSSSRRASKRL